LLGEGLFGEFPLSECLVQLPSEVVLLLKSLLHNQVIRGLVRLPSAAVRGVFVRLRDLINLDSLDKLLKVQEFLLVPVDLNDGAEGFGLGPCVVLGTFRGLLAFLALLPSRRCFLMLCCLLAQRGLWSNELGCPKTRISLCEWLLS
jgi:hypothetical protein